MKKIGLLFILCMLFLPNNLFSQKGNEELELVQDIFGISKQQMIMDYMQLSDAEGKKFWAVYGEYENERVSLVNKRIEKLKKFYDENTEFDDETAKTITMDLLDNDIARAELHKKYFKKFTTAVGAYTAAKFFQVENYIETSVELSIQENIPFLGDLEEGFLELPEN